MLLKIEGQRLNIEKIKRKHCVDVSKKEIVELIYMSTEISTRETLGMMGRGQNTRRRMWPRIARRRLQQEGSAQGAGESASLEPFLHAFHVKCVAAPP